VVIFICALLIRKWNFEEISASGWYTIFTMNTCNFRDMKKTCFLFAAFLLCVVSCRNGAKDDKNEATKYPTYDTNKVEGKNTPGHSARVPGDTVH
jgi:hypothetical protein